MDLRVKKNRNSRNVRSAFRNFSLLLDLRIYIALWLFQPYHDLEAGDINQKLNSSGQTGNRTPDIVLGKPLNHYTTAAPLSEIYT